jgi:predicted dehydrogenase
VLLPDLDPKVRQLNQSLYQNTTVSADYHQLLDDDRLDAIVVATPTETHFEIISKVLLAGKHCFSEKPLTLIPEQAQRLVKLAQQQKRLLMVGHLLKYHPAILYIKKLLLDHALGELLYIYSKRLNLGTVRAFENCWWSLAPHDLSLILYFLEGEPTHISATGSCFLQKDIEDVVFASLFYPQHPLAHIHVSWLDPHKVRTLTLVGSKKMLTFNDMEPSEKIRIYDKGASISEDFTPFAWFGGIHSGDVHIPHLVQKEPLREECLHFVECLLEGKSCRTPAEEGAKVVHLLAKGQESLFQKGHPISLRNE